MRMDIQRRATGSARATPLRAAVIGLFGVLLATAAAPAEEARFAGSWLDLGGDLRGAFVSVVDEARRSTVNVLVDDQRVALGVVVDPDGWIITKGSDLRENVRCRLPDGRELAATQRGYDRNTDLTMLKVEASGLATIRWSETGDPQIGDWLATVGADSSPIAIGIVSVARREIPVQKISGVLGVRLDEKAEHAQIAEIIDDSAAAAADLQPGDVIMQVADRRIDDRASLIRVIRDHEPGTTVQITIRRGDAELVLPATLTHPFGQFLTRIAQQNHMGGSLSLRRTGFPAVLQHDTVLAPEDCGGPIVDLDGAAIGLNIARAGRTESYALPADVVIGVINSLRSAGTEQPAVASETTPDADAATTTVDTGAQ